MATTTLTAVNLTKAEDKSEPEFLLENLDDEITEEERKHDQDGQSLKQNAQIHFVRTQRYGFEHKSRNVKKRTLESFISSESLRALADEVTKPARLQKRL
jgi:hypothetical protein